MRITDEGRFDPVVIMWPDGRSFHVDEIIERGVFGPSYRGISTARYRIRIGSRITSLFLERRTYDATLGKPPVERFWVEAFG